MQSSQAKYQSRNPLSQYLISDFYTHLGRLAGEVQAGSVLEVGCGEGVVLTRLGAQLAGKDIVGTDINPERVFLAASSVPFARFVISSIYELPLTDSRFDLVICCEVLEHLTEPDAALSELARVCRRHVLLSVPNEPIWRILNMARGAYWRALGNTPGHINHWSSAGFSKLVSRYFAIHAVRRPLPWTLLLGEKI